MTNELRDVPWPRSPQARTLTPVAPSAIVRASLSALRYARRANNAQYDAPIIAAASAFNLQAQPLAH
jgi:hypothetical protein